MKIPLKKIVEKSIIIRIIKIIKLIKVKSINFINNIGNIYPFIFFKLFIIKKVIRRCMSTLVIVFLFFKSK